MSRDRQSAADYVAALSAELAEIARKHGLDASAYMLEVAAVEAASWTPDSGTGSPRPSDASSPSVEVIATCSDGRNTRAQRSTAS
jgi:hypothetical protein